MNIKNCNWKDMDGSVKEGELLLLSKGEYSDYGIETLLRATHDCDVKDYINSYLIQHPECSKKYSFEADQFISYLLHSGSFDLVDYREFYLGSYNDIEDIELYKE